MLRHADAIIILTEWEEYKYINWENIASLMRKPSWIFDTRGILDSNLIKRFGFKIWVLGEPE